MYLPHLAECIEDGVTFVSSWDRRHALHLRKGSSASSNNVGKSGDYLRKWALADDNERTVDDGDTLSWCLKSLALLGDHLEVGDDLLWSRLCNNGSDHGQRGEKDLVEGNHDDEVVWVV